MQSSSKVNKQQDRRLQVDVHSVAACCLASCCLATHKHLPSCQKNIMPYPGQLMMAFGGASKFVAMVTAVCRASLQAAVPAGLPNHQLQALWKIS